MTKTKVEMYNESGNCISEKSDGNKEFLIEIFELKNGKRETILFQKGDTLKVVLDNEEVLQ